MAGFWTILKMRTLWGERYTFSFLHICSPIPVMARGVQIGTQYWIWTSCKNCYLPMNKLHQKGYEMVKAACNAKIFTQVLAEQRAVFAMNFIGLAAETDVTVWFFVHPPLSCTHPSKQKIDFMWPTSGEDRWPHNSKGTMNNLQIWRCFKSISVYCAGDTNRYSEVTCIGLSRTSANLAPLKFFQFANALFRSAIPNF